MNRNDVMRNAERAGAIAMVIDRAHAAEVRPTIIDMGGGWSRGFELWEGLPQMGCLVLVAPSRKRIRQRAPMVLMGALADVMAGAIDLLSDVECLWVILPDGEDREVVSRMALADAQPSGNA